MARRVPRLLPEFNESFFKQSLKDLGQKLLAQKDKEAEMLYQRIVLGLIAPNCKLTEININNTMKKQFNCIIKCQHQFLLNI